MLIYTAGNNLITIDPQRATTGGYEHKEIEVFPERQIPVWITFKGGLYEDVEVPYVKDINLKDGINYS